MEKTGNILILIIYIIILILLQFVGVHNEFRNYITPVGLIITLIVFGLSILIELPSGELSSSQKNRFKSVFFILSVLIILIVYISFFYDNTLKKLKLDDLLNALGLMFAISSNHWIKWLAKSIKNGFK